MIINNPHFGEVGHFISTKDPGEGHKYVICLCGAFLDKITHSWYLQQAKYVTCEACLLLHALDPSQTKKMYK